MGWAGWVFAQPITDWVGGFLICNRPVTVTGSLVRVAGGWLLVSGETNNHQNLLKRGRISLDLARFLPNCVEKSLVRPDPVFFCQKLTDLSEKVAGNLGKNGWS